jgi:3-deoxy-D-manno-octulosonic-acid transferase
LTRLLYSFFVWLVQPFVRRKLARRAVQEPGYLQAVEERFGHYTVAPTASADTTTLWVHAVSLGETRAAAVLLVRLRELLPGMRLLLTHGTATGRAEGAALLRAGDIQIWQPWDTSSAVQRFLTHFKPRLGILMETEIWPNLVAGCAKLGVPLVLANARLSEKSQRQARRLKWLSDPAYSALTAVWAQTEDDARRLTQQGAMVLGVFGNLKFDATPDAQQLATGRTWRSGLGRPVVMFASSRAGEEESLLQLLASQKSLARVDGASAAVRSGVNGIQWLIVPRHPQRFDAVAALIVQHGFAVARRSTWGAVSPAGEGPDADAIWLGDSLGEMALYYGLADVALLGGSFEPLGGQNLIEAAACACPVVMGPHTFNFAEAAELAQAAGAALRVTSLQQAVDVARTLASDPAARAAVANAGARFSIAHRGAVEKTAAAVIALLGQQGVDAL